MPRYSWVLRHGFRTVVESPPDFCPWDFSDLSATVGFPAVCTPSLYDHLDWGPQHADFQTQQLMRACYFQGQLHDDARLLVRTLDRVRPGDEIVLWGDSTLPNCLSLLWAFDWLHAHGAAMEQVSLVIDPRDRALDPATVEDFHRLFAARLPLIEWVKPLIELRRFLASDSDAVDPDLSQFSGPLGEWLQVTRLLAWYLPDDRGLDVIDDRLLEWSTEDWQPAMYLLGAKPMISLPRFCLGHDHLWLRLLELSNYQHCFSVSFGPSVALCELQVDPSRSTGRNLARITPEGKSVRSGKCDSHWHRHTHRWVGGRLLDGVRDLRFPGSHRQPEFAGMAEPGKPLEVGEQGTYLQLAARPLPDGLALRFAPDEDPLSRFQDAEGIRGRFIRQDVEEGGLDCPLTRQEVLAVRNTCKVIVVEAGAPDDGPSAGIDPVDPWPGWERHRSGE